MFVDFFDALSTNTEGLFGGLVEFIGGTWDAFGGLFDGFLGSSIEGADQ